MPKRYPVTFICIFFIASSLFYYFLFTKGFFPIQNQKTSNRSLNAFTNASKSKRYDDKGKMNLAVKSKHSDHFESPASTIFTEPNFTLPSENKTVWHIHSNHGQSFNGGKKIILWGNVILHRPEIPQYPDTIIKTQHLTYFNTEDYAISNTMTTVTQPGNASSGNDVRINFKNNNIRIKDHAQGVFSANNNDNKD